MKNKLVWSVEKSSISLSVLPEVKVDLRPEFFYFLFYRPSRPNFLEIENKIKEIFFQFYFFISLRLMPVQYWSSVMFFRLSFLLLQG